MAESCSVFSLLLLLLLCTPLAQGNTPAKPTNSSSTIKTTVNIGTSTTTKATNSTVKITLNTATAASTSLHASNGTTDMTEHSSAAVNTSPYKTEAVTKNTAHSGGTHGAEITASTSNHTTLHTNRTESSNEPHASKGLSDNPGLVAVLCIFISVLCIALVVTAVKFCQKPNPKFEKLDEVPMNGMNEEAPFARYPPK